MPSNPLRRMKARSFNSRQGWTFSGGVGEGQAMQDWPVNFWNYKWVSAGQSVELRDPLYGQRRMVRRWIVEAEGKRYGFAADEFSNGVWAFFLPA